MVSLILQGVSAAFRDRQVLSGITTPALHGGQLVALLGPNGGGKSTLFRRIFGLPGGAGQIGVEGATVPRPMHQEIFGPILPVVSYRSIDEVIAVINARPRPLALYHFGTDDVDRRRLLDRTASGNVGLNTTLMRYAQDDRPFGGVGAYHRIEGFRGVIIGVLKGHQAGLGAAELCRKHGISDATFDVTVRHDRPAAGWE